MDCCQWLMEQNHASENKVTLKNCASSAKCITKTDGTIIEYAGDLEWLCRCITCYNTVGIIMKRQIV